MKILNFGSLNIDYTYDVEHFVRPGETLMSGAQQICSGGKGLNQSIALSRCGAQTCHAGAVGEADGGFLLEMLSAAGVDVAGIRRVPGASGHAIIQRDPAGQNCILLYGGANQTVTGRQAREVLADFGPGDWLVLQNEISAVGEIMELAHEKGMRIALNPSPMDAKILALPLEYVELLILNEVEAGALTHLEADADGRTLLAALREKFPEAMVVLTLGGAGALCACESGEYAQRAYSVNAVDTTGAGDTFTGFFLGSMVQGRSVEEAMDRAAAAAALEVSRPGAAPSIPTAREVDDFLRERKG